MRARSSSSSCLASAGRCRPGGEGSWGRRVPAEVNGAVAGRERRGRARSGDSPVHREQPLGSLPDGDAPDGVEDHVERLAVLHELAEHVERLPDANVLHAPRVQAGFEQRPFAQRRLLPFFPFALVVLCGRRAYGIEGEFMAFGVTGGSSLSSSIADSGTCTQIRTPLRPSICVANAPTPSCARKTRARTREVDACPEELLAGGESTSVNVRTARCAGMPHRGRSASSSIVSGAGERGEGEMGYACPLTGREALRKCVRRRGGNNVVVRARGCGARCTR